MIPTASGGFDLGSYVARVGRMQTTPVGGRVERVVGVHVESDGPAASVGEVCEIRTERGFTLSAEVVGFRDGRLLSVPLGETAGIRPGDPILSTGQALTVPVGEALLGRVIDFLRTMQLPPPHRQIAAAAYRARNRACRDLAAGPALVQSSNDAAHV
jgi:flagellar biosynthesis/type III secretory pathway ATPase